MDKMEMTVLDMMNEIAKKTKALDDSQPGEERAIAIEDANLIANLSKNFFVGASLAVEKERIKAKYKTLDNSILDKVIGTL